MTLTCSLTLAAHESSAANWSTVNEGSISVYTQSDSGPAAALIHSFSQLRSALAQDPAYRSQQNAYQAAKLKVIAFRSASEFNQYRLNEGSCAFYQQTRGSEYVVIHSLSARPQEVFFHEFTHFFLAHTGLSIPLWLNEGLADFYSTFQISSQTVTFGAPVSGRLHILKSNAWLPLDNLFEVSTGSPYYSEPGHMALFYSESWALAHMLAASPAYGDRFPNFLRALNDGHSPAESLKLIYNKTTAQVENDLHEYVNYQHLPTIQAHFTEPANASSQSSVASVSNAEMDIALADLKMTNAHTNASIESRLAADAKELPGKPEPEESLGYLALQNGKSTEARAHFRLAADRGSIDPNVIFYLAHLDHEAGAPSSQVMPLLERALSLKPDLGDARLELALLATEDGKYEQALSALKQLKTVRPQNAYAAAYTEAYCYANTDKPAEALSAARRAQTLAANDHDRAEVSQLLESIDQQSKELVASTNVP